MTKTNNIADCAGVNDLHHPEGRGLQCHVKNRGLIIVRATKSALCTGLRLSSIPGADNAEGGARRRQSRRRRQCRGEAKLRSLRSSPFLIRCKVGKNFFAIVGNTLLRDLDRGFLDSQRHLPGVRQRSLPGRKPSRLRGLRPRLPELVWSR